MVLKFLLCAVLAALIFPEPSMGETGKYKYFFYFIFVRPDGSYRSPNVLNLCLDKVVCYWGSWSNYREGDYQFMIEDIDARLCTHLIYTFVGLNPNGTIRILDSWLDIDLGGFRRFNALREHNPKAQTLVAIGGWNEGSETYSAVVANPNLRATFIRDAVNFVLHHGFNGFDLDWEYPGQRGGKPEDKENFAILVKEMRTEFDKHDLLLTAAVGATQTAIDISYDVPVLSK